MTDSAPGQAPKPGEPSCYNCGTLGHWAIACPEPTRETPAGLLAWRRTSSGASQPKRGDSHSGSKGRGPVVTRYPAPPSAPVITRYEPPPPTYPNPPAPYPPPTHSAAPYPPPPTHGHGSIPPYPPPPPPTSSQAPYPPYPPQGSPPPPSYPPSHGGAYGRPPTHAHQPPPYPPPLPPTPHVHGDRPSYPPVPPPPIHYGQQPPYSQSYPPPAYPGSTGLPPAPPPPPQGYAPPPSYPPANYAPPPPYSSNGYPPPTPAPPPPPGAYYPPQPPHSSQPPRGEFSPPPPGLPPHPYGPHLGHDGPYGAGEGGRGLPRPPHRQQSFKDKNNRHRRDHQNRQDRPSKDRSNNSHRHNRQDASQNGGQRKPQKPLQVIDAEKILGAGASKPQAGRAKDVDPGSDAPVKPNQKETAPEPAKTSKDPDAEDKQEDDGDEWEWEEKQAFKDFVITHPADEIGKPLPGPGAYHDDLMLPPAWNAKCMQSEFITDDNIDEYSRPIRETQYFEAMALDPAFMKGGVKPSLPANLHKPAPRQDQTAKPVEKAPAVILTGKASLPPKPPAPEKPMDWRAGTDRKRAWEEFSRPDIRHGTPRDKSEVGRKEEKDKRNKRQRPDRSPLASARRERSLSPKRRHRSRSRSAEDRRGRPGQTHRRDRPLGRDLSEDDPTRTLLRSLDNADEQTASWTALRHRDSGSTPGGNRQSSGYDSRSMERHGSSAGKADCNKPPPLPRATSPSEIRPGNRRDSHGGSRPVSRESGESPISYESDSSLDEVEAALLGLPYKPKGSKTSGGQNLSCDGETLKKPRRRPKVDSAYSRRW